MTELEGFFDPHRYEDSTRAPSFDRRPEQRFDRIAFAVRALNQLSPPRTRVAVFPSNRFVVKQGLDLMRGLHARWAMVGIPRDASARSIVLALTRIDGVPRAPYALETTLEAAALAARAN